MIFSSILFTFGFLPIVIFLYFLAKEKYRNYILLVASIIFYAYGEPKFILIMICSVIINYWLARAINNSNDMLGRKVLLVIDIALNLSILFVFKYLNFSIGIWNSLLNTSYSTVAIALPIGISFYTFQALSYVVDVYRKDVKAEKNICVVALYIAFFPQLVAGPIIRYHTIAEQISQRETSLEKIGEGCKRFILGFSKKVILANNLAVVAEKAFFDTDLMMNSIAFLWIGAICFSLQIYYDFSGYSDMAIGLGKIFGFDIEENFNYPYFSKSITDFWRRWHISLGRWFRDYVYISLGGSRVNIAKHIRNLFVVWLLTGIWHGANYTFIVWGLFYFVLLVVEKFFIKPEKDRGKLLRGLWQIVTLILVNFGWVIFNSSSLKSGLQYCLRMLGIYGERVIVDSNVMWSLREYGIFMILGILFAAPFTSWMNNKLDNVGWSSCIRTVILPIGYCAVFLWAVSYLVLGAHNPFIYFNF